MSEYIMKRVEILCPECMKKKLIHEKGNDLYCDNCGTEFYYTNKDKKSIKYK